MNRSDWVRALQNMPAVARAGLLDFQPLRGQHSNYSARVRTGEGAWAVRLNQPLPGANRHFEAHVLRRIGPLGLAPELIDADPESGYLITRWQDARPWTFSQAANESAQRQLAARLRRLQEVDLRSFNAPPGVHLQQRLKAYLDDARWPADHPLKRALQKPFQTLLDCGFFASPAQLLHGDLLHSNILGGASLVLIDWEYAGVGPGLFDAFVFMQAHRLSIAQCAPLLSASPGWAEWSSVADALQHVVSAMVNIWTALQRPD